MCQYIRVSMQTKPLTDCIDQQICSEIYPYSFVVPGTESYSAYFAFWSLFSWYNCFAEIQYALDSTFSNFAPGIEPKKKWNVGGRLCLDWAPFTMPAEVGVWRKAYCLFLIIHLTCFLSATLTLPVCLDVTLVTAFLLGVIHFFFRQTLWRDDKTILTFWPWPCDPYMGCSFHVWYKVKA